MDIRMNNSCAISNQMQRNVQNKTKTNVKKSEYIKAFAQVLFISLLLLFVVVIYVC